MLHKYGSFKSDVQYLTCRKVSRCRSKPELTAKLQPDDRVSLSSLTQQNYSVREIASVLGRSASTISRELRRNVLVGQYSSTATQKTCQHRHRQGRPIRELNFDAI